MSSIIESLDRLQKEEQQAGPKPEPAVEISSKDSLFSKFGILLWLSASISATVFSYHLGVTQGMQAVKEESPKEWLHYFSEFSPNQAPAAPVKEKAQPQTVEAEKNPAKQTPVSEQAPEVKSAEASKQGFTIQVITYVSERLANEEVQRLSKKGHKAFVVPSGKYFQVCVDIFQNKKLALQKLTQLRSLEIYKTSYPGAYVKFLKK